MVSTIVVVGKNREIGNKNKLLWSIPEDMQRFRKLTMGKTVVMGDKTFESIGKPLPGRKNVVVTLNKGYNAPGCDVRFSLEEVLQDAKESDEEVFVIGGGQVYKQALPYTDKLYITVVDDEPEADTFFPDYSDFKTVLHERKSRDGNLEYTFYELAR